MNVCGFWVVEMNASVIADLIVKLLSADRPQTIIENNNLVISLGGQTINIPLSNSQIVRSSIGGFR